MKTYITLFIILFIQSSIYAQNFEWAIGSNGYVCTGKKVTTDDFGNIYVTGGYEGLDMTLDSITIPYEYFGSEIFVAKFNPQGIPLWIKSAQGYYNDWGLALSTKDNSQDLFQGAGFVSPVLTVGEDTLYNSVSTNIYLTRLDENGNKIWLQQYGSNETINLNGISYFDDQLVAVGSFKGNDLQLGTDSFNSSGGDDAFLFATDEDGVYQWGKTFGTSEFESIVDFEHLPNGDMALAVVFGGDSLTVDNQTFYGTPGVTSSALLKVNSNGNLIWGKVFSEDDAIHVKSVATSQYNDIVVGGQFKSDTLFIANDTLVNKGETNGWISAYDVSGNLEWTKIIESTNVATVKSLEISRQDSLIVTGDFKADSLLSPAYLPSNGLFDIFLLGMDINGNDYWQYIIGGQSTDNAKDIAVDTLGNFFFLGDHISNPMSFETYQFTTNFNGFEFFLTKIGDQINVNELESKSLHQPLLYPNPAGNSIVVRLQYATHSDYSIQDISGQIVQKGTINGTETELSIESLKNGVYIIRFNGSISPIRFIKQ